MTIGPQNKCAVKCNSLALAGSKLVCSLSQLQHQLLSFWFVSSLHKVAVHDAKQYLGITQNEVWQEHVYISTTLC